MKEAVKKYVSVVKPGVVLGNLISAAGGFLLAAKGRIDATVLMSAVIGISLVVASGCVFNNCVDRKMDLKMARTRNRVLAQGLMSPGPALVYASLLGLAGAALLWTGTNALAVAVVIAGFAIYVGVYSLCLKRRSAHAALIGSLAGAAPPLAGYCAVSNHFDMGALILASIFGLWQIPHSYAIAVFRFEDYAAADIPVLPVKRGVLSAKTHILVYILAFLAAAPMLTLSGYTGARYFAAAAAVGLTWLYMAWTGYRTSDEKLWGKKLFVFSIVGITVLSLMMSIDFTTPIPSDVLLTLSRRP